MKIFISGYSGLIGSLLRKSLYENGNEIILLGRKPDNLRAREEFNFIDLKGYPTFLETLDHNDKFIFFHCAYDFLDMRANIENRN